jgi:hypothetical protein
MTAVFEEKAVELINRFDTLATEVAPQIVDLGLLTARIAAGTAVLWSVVGLATMVICIYISYRGFRRTDGIDIPEDPDSSEYSLAKTKMMYAESSMFAYGVLSVMGFLTFVTNFSLFAFVGVFYPQVWIAKIVLGW